MEPKGGKVPEHVENYAHACVGEIGVTHIRELIKALTVIAEGREARLAGKWLPKLRATA